MHLYDVPLLIALLGLVLYVVLGGADFGAGFWQLLAGGGKRGERIREHAHESMAPVWEANHVWLVFVLVVMWTCYPEAFASIASTLSIPLFIAAIGIVFRGAAYALRAGTARARELRAIDTVFAISSVLTPFALGCVIGGIASERVPVGNAQGDMWSSWLNPTAITIGVIAVAFSAYVAAVYLAADAARHGDAEMEAAFRARALGAGVVAGVVAAAGLFVLRDDARHLFDELVSGAALVVTIVSALAGAATIALVWQRRYEWARYTAAGAVAAVIVAWAIAQSPTLLPGLTVEQAAAGDDTLVAVIVAVVAGALILFPSLALLFTLTLRGQLGHHEEADAAAARARQALRPTRTALLVRIAGACLVVTLGFLTIADAGWMHAVGVFALLGFVVCGFLAAVPLDDQAPVA
jgi:cytochrome bd ubiquinol oxidase subunit II